MTPVKPLRFLRFICPAHLVDEIEGDVIEKYERDVLRFNTRKAKIRMWWNVIRFFRPEIVLRRPFTVSPFQPTMIGNYVKVASRNMTRHLLYTWINIFSLAIGLSVCVVIALFVLDESKFDSLHQNGRNIWRLNELQKLSNGNWQKVALTGTPFGPGIRDAFPEVQNFCRVLPMGRITLGTSTTKLLPRNELLMVDSVFLEIFDFELLHGDRRTLLDEPNSIVLTESSSKKLFGEPSLALGKTILIGDDQEAFTITGILRDVPEHSHLQFEAVLSYTTRTHRHPELNTDWIDNSIFTYFTLHPNTDVQRLQSKFPEWLIRWTETKDVNNSYGIFLQPLSEIHLKSTEIEHDYLNYRKFNGRYLNIFTGVGAFILVVAIINFMNLTIARGMYRRKEISVRKTIGANRRQLLFQFVVESIVMGLIALFAAVFIDLVALRFINTWIGRNLEIYSLFRIDYLCFVILLTTFLSIVSAIYPTLQATRIHPIHAVKSLIPSDSKSPLQGSLIVFQFSLATTMIVSSLIVMQQLAFIQKQDLGFNKSLLMLIPLNKEANSKFNILKTELLRLNFVAGVTASGQRLGNNLHQTTFTVRKDSSMSSGYSSFINVEKDFLNVYGIKLLKGRNFSQEIGSDSAEAFVINQSMANEHQLTSGPGTDAGLGEKITGKIIGVVPDFKFNSLHYKVSSLSMISKPDWGFDEMSIRIAGPAINEAISGIEDVWNDHVDTQLFSYSFLGEHIEKLYQDDQQLSIVVRMMATIAVLISCMGLFGLAAIITRKRTKEIVIRKIMGATSFQMTISLSRNFVFLIGASVLFSGQITYALLSNWLQNFAYRIQIQVLPFFAGAGVAMIIGILTIGYHTTRAARINPADNLKSE